MLHFIGKLRAYRIACNTPTATRFCCGCTLDIGAW
jgi:hypothetical protein